MIADGPPACRVLGCNNAVTTVIQAADADGDSVIDEEEFRALAACSSHEAGWHDGFESTLFTPHQINIDENDWGGR